MAIRDDAIFLAGFITGTYAKRDNAEPPAYVQPFIDRILMQAKPPEFPPLGKIEGKHADVFIIDDPLAPSPELTPELKSDEEKIAAHIEEKGVIKPKQKRDWSPEQREAAAQRMRDTQARLKAAKGEPAVTITIAGKPLEEANKADYRASGEVFREEKPLPRVDTPPEELIERHNELAGKCDDGELTEADWGDIKPLCQRGRNHRQIASDYGVDPAKMKQFIDRMLTLDARRLDDKRK